MYGALVFMVAGRIGALVFMLAGRIFDATLGYPGEGPQKMCCGCQKMFDGSREDSACQDCRSTTARSGVYSRVVSSDRLDAAESISLCFDTK